MNAKRNEFSEAERGELPDIDSRMRAIGGAARAAASHMAKAGTKAKNAALRAAAVELRKSESRILAANAGDIRAMLETEVSAAAVDRATLNPARILAMAESLEAIADLPDPVGSVIAEWERPNGMRIQRVRTPLGVVGVIFESRPNVTADAGALCLKAGNAVILRGGSDTLATAAAIHDCLFVGFLA